MDDSRHDGLTGLLGSLGLEPPESGLGLLDTALTHRSWRVENGFETDNERLEFLGDAVIGLATTEFLYRSRPDEAEGDMSRLRAAMVSRRVLGEIALELGIGDLLRVGAGEEVCGGRRRHSTLGSALEAVCGALYMLYPWGSVREVLRSTVIDRALELAGGDLVTDYKSRLQEWTQKTLQAIPEYEVRSSDGPDHQREFMVVVTIAGEVYAEGRGSRIKAAENDAARAALERVSQEA